MQSELSSQMSTPRPNISEPMVRLKELTLDSQGLFDLLFSGGANDPNGLRSALLLVFFLVLSGAVALLTGRSLRKFARSRLRHRQSETSRWLRAIVITEILLFLFCSSLAVRGWLVKASSLGLLAGMLGITGLIFGFRRALDNTIAGIMFSIRGSIRHGDSIEVVKVRGTVHQIGLTHTQLSGVDGSMYWVPNRVLNQSILRIGKIKNVTIITVALPSNLSGDTYERLRLRAYLCPYRRANSPVRVVDRDTQHPKLEVQTWAMRDGTRATAHLESWVEQSLKERRDHDLSASERSATV